MDNILKKFKNNVVIIDSGIDINNKDFSECIIGGLSFEYDNNKELVIKKDSYNDENGHGTFCASMIQRVSSNVNIFVVKILNKEAETHSKALIEALKYIKNIDIRVVNLSVATINEKYKNELYKVCNELYKQGKIIICSLENSNNDSFPAVFKNVIGVRGMPFANSYNYWYNSAKKIQCVADITPVLVPTLDNKYKMFGGNSKATSLFTGLVLNILAKNDNISFEELNQLLEYKAVKNSWDDDDTNDINSCSCEISNWKSNYSKKNLMKLEKIFVKVLNLPQQDIPLLYKYMLPNDKIHYKSKDFYEITKNIEKEFNIKIDYKLLSFSTFQSIYSLLDFINVRVNHDYR
ncbi:S8 family serine peptidase [Tissierella sp. MB52-C2]|uniref:S8 family serine peptidase n=1 Tax=Tissierella sp. MB52-C2 TaxID=3070999 RepID=UPI00280AD38F|nr:S8 family serine peptidase [Tissierella sp. MB52-C2]WMM26562.1 S8 family serine peptidase [Tissierella sp. MB52-C2]